MSTLLDLSQHSSLFVQDSGTFPTVFIIQTYPYSPGWESPAVVGEIGERARRRMQQGTGSRV